MFVWERGADRGVGGPLTSSNPAVDALMAACMAPAQPPGGGERAQRCLDEAPHALDQPQGVGWPPWSPRGVGALPTSRTHRLWRGQQTPPTATLPARRSRCHLPLAITGLAPSSPAQESEQVTVIQTCLLALWRGPVPLVLLGVHPRPWPPAPPQCTLTSCPGLRLSLPGVPWVVSSTLGGLLLGPPSVNPPKQRRPCQRC